MIKKILIIASFLVYSVMYSQPLYNQWMWIDGSKTANEKIADFGLIGLEDINNWPYGRKSSSGITDNNGNLILFGGWFEGQGATNELWSYNPTSNNWTYKKGSIFKYYPGNYHSEGLGIEHRKNNPNIRSNSQIWKDSNGNIWVFGGSSYTSNDLWKYNTQTNNWIHITPADGNPDGNYGTQGVESSQNIPPNISYGTTWTDLNGNLWMFGGQKTNHNYNTEAGWDSFNSMWKYNIATGNWTWISGSNTHNELGRYGVLGVESPLNHPGARSNAASWVDSEGNLWMFGGFGSYQNNTDGSAFAVRQYNDIWKFNPNTGLWTWVKGNVNTVENIVTFNSEHSNNRPKGISDTKPIYWKDNSNNFWYFDGSIDNRLWMFNPATTNWILKKQQNSLVPQYGNLGISNSNNTPGQRVSGTTWTSASGDLYLFSGSDSPYGNAYNDLWKYSINDNSWTWVKSPSTENPAHQRIKLVGAYDEDIHPGYLENYTASWNDSEGNLWVYGITGEGYDNDVTAKDHLWKYNSSTKKWQWISGLFDWPRTYNTYGTLGVEGYSNNPIARIGAMSWIDPSDNLWLFGGSKSGMYNDLWKYNKVTNKWVWVNGSNLSNQVSNQYGVYGSQGVPAPTNQPGWRSNGASWTDNQGNLWLFGGSGAASASSGRLNDLWKYDVTANQWTWIKGSSSVNQPEVSAGLGIANPNNTPAASDNTLNWKDNSGNFWLYTNGTLWKFSNNNWIKIKQTQTLNYGTIGVYHDNNSPGLRLNSATWVDNDGNLLLFGNEAVVHAQDLWKYNITQNQWVWIGGRKYTNFNNDAKANFGQINESFISNLPGGRKKTVSWKDNNGNFYLYGGIGWDENLEGKLSDIWKTNRNFNTFSGNIKFNSNNNECWNSTINVPNAKVTFSSNSDNKFTFSNALGNFSEISESNSVTVTPSLEYYTFSPTSQTLNNNAYGNIQNINFCASATGTHNDLEIVIIPTTDAVPGFNAVYKIVYRNRGTTTLSGSVSLNYNSNNLSFISSSSPPQTQNTGLLTWNYSNLAPFQSRSITATLRVNAPTDTSPVNSGDVLNFIAIVNPVSADETAQNNSFNLNQTAVNAIDPNDKTCLEGEIVGTNYINEYVNYVIRFENTGTAKATHIVIDDLIDTSKFDVSSILPVDASHNYKMIVSNNKVSFVFEYIDLPFPPSTFRYGYVVFKIKTKATLVPGDTFTNSANIYFDYNSPISTNEYSTTIATLGTNDINNSNEVDIFPNPAKDIVNIKSDIIVKKIEIFDSMGRILQSLNNPGNQINLINLKRGVYIIKIYDSNGSYSKKILKE